MSRPTPSRKAADAERERSRAFLRLPMDERLRRGVAFSKFALRNFGAARRAKR
ncbi:MAG: hypothetical protein ACRDPC_01580 [Solirubrobacteraceae bacterium]